jgi:hypothetical protein
MFIALRYAVAASRSHDFQLLQSISQIRAAFRIGGGMGETELDNMTRLVWLERQNDLDAIEKAVATALECERGPVTRKAKVLQWKTAFAAQPAPS